MAQAKETQDTLTDRAFDAVEAARGEISSLRERIEALMKERVSPALSHAAGQAEDMAHAAADTVRRQKGAAVDSIRAQPLAAVGVAVLAGLALGFMLRR